MSLEIFNTPFIVTLHGFSGKAVNKNYGETGRPLMDTMWKEIKSKGIKNKGINFWVYERHEMLFCGVELDQEAPDGLTLETKQINLPKYARWKHVGSYAKLKDAYAAMHSELEKRKIAFHYPFLEIYGHWTNDETKLETDIIYTID